MEMRVHRVNQAASGGSYVVIFDADVDLHDRPGVTVEVLSFEPADSEAVLVEEARQAIQRGAERVLPPMSKGASLRVRNLVIHMIDFKPLRFEIFTTDELQKLLEEA